MKVTRTLLLALALLSSASPLQASETTFGALDRAISTEDGTSVDPLICRDDGDNVQREIDLLLLLDNSTSLNLAKAPSDSERLRFSAIRRLLEAVGSAVDNADVPLDVRFGALTFSARAQELVSLAENRTITGVTATSIAAEIEKRLPNETQQNGTNYLNALDAAFQQFSESSSSDRCRVLVWLTDGEFSHGGSNRQTDEALTGLFDSVCDPGGGFAARARDSKTRIWPFVVLLAPPSSESTDPRRANIIRESYDLMRRLTGAPFESGNGQSRSVCPSNGLDSRIGSIYGAEMAESLGPVFEELGNQISGGLLIDACPVIVPKNNDQELRYESIPLPAPRFLTWISMVSLSRGPLPSVTNISIVDRDDREVGLLPHFEFRETSKTSLFLDAIGFSKLETGWKLKIVGTNLEGFCLRAKVREGAAIKVKRQGAQLPALSWDDGATNFTEDDLGRVEFLLDGDSIDLPQLGKLKERDAQRLTARLEVDPSGKLLPDGLPIRVTGFSTLPSFDTQTCDRLRIPKPGVSGRGDTPDAKQFSSSSCLVDLRGIESEIEVDVAQAQMSLRGIAGCENVSLVSTVNGDEESRFSGDAIFDVGLLLKFDAASLQCSNFMQSAGGLPASEIDLPLKLKYLIDAGTSSLNETRQISVSVDIDVKAPPNPRIVWLITLALLLLAVLLSFALLWLMNLLVIRLPEPYKFHAAKFPITISSRDPMKPEFQIGDLKVDRQVIDVSKFAGIRGDRQSWSASNGLSLRRKLANPLLRPLEEPRAIFESAPTSNVVVAYGPTFNQKGLALPFRRAIVMVFERPDSEVALVRGHVYLLVPTDPGEGGREAVEQLLDTSVMLQLVRAVLRAEILVPRTKGQPEASSESGADAKQDRNQKREVKQPRAPRGQR